MEVSMKKVSRTALGIALMTLMMTGCGEAKVPDTIDKPMISISKSGEVTEYLVGEFSGKDYYSISGLSSMAAEEAAQYNTANQRGTATPVKVEKVEALEDGSNRVYIVYRYDSAESYTGFNRERYSSGEDDTSFNRGSLFFGTVGEAASQGYSTDIALKSANDKKEDGLTTDQVKQATDKRLIIAPQGVYVYCPGKVEYISFNAVMAEDGSVNGTVAEGPVYILLK